MMVFDLIRVSDEVIILECVGTMDIERYVLEHSCQDTLQQAWAALQSVPSYVEGQAAQFASEPVEEHPPLKYIRFNVSRMNAPTWAHIASGKPFHLMQGRYGRWSSTLCGKEYEMDDYSKVDEVEAKKYLCKQCAKQRRIEHSR